MPAQNQKALLLESKQGKFIVGERDVPKPRRGELVIKVHAAALNPVDWKIQKTGMFIENYPAVLGTDMAGVVEVVGEGVGKFAKGDKVFAHGNFTNDQSSFQQYAVSVADYTAKIPPNLDFDHAATVPLGFDTASVGLYSDQLGAGLTPPWVEGGHGKYAGLPILIMGGSASVGMYAIQLAKLSGFSPIITTASQARQDELKALGATDVIDKNLTVNEFAEAVKKVTQQPIGVAYDVIATEKTQQNAWAVLARGGTLVLTIPALVKEEDGLGRSAITTYGNPHSQTNNAMCSDSWKVLGRWLQDGIIKPNKPEVLPKGLGGIPDGLERLKEGRVSGIKLVARPQETA